MKLFTPEISWHQREPILSVDFCPTTKHLASGGADFTVKVWKVKEDDKGNVGLDFLSNLEHHTKPVNAVRFSPNGNILASGGDDYVIIIWARNKSDDEIPSSSFSDPDQMINKETWSFTKVLRGHVEDVYDIAWSPDGTQLISGSVDNSAIVWDALKGQKLFITNDHHHYIQGVTWDPLGQLIATHSSDRSCKIYNASTHRCLHTIHKTREFRKLESHEQPKQFKLFLDETMQSFFRRCSFSPDGSLLVLPGGIYEAGGKVHKTTYVYVRGHYTRPVIHLPSLKKPSIAVKFCPVIFDFIEKEDKEKKSLFEFPYRMVFAVATLDSVTLYDTQHLKPFAHVSNIHYASITDLAWSSDGKMLVVSSMDGYCSFLVFDMEKMGKESTINPLEIQTPEKIEKLPTPEKCNENAKAAIDDEINNLPPASKTSPTIVQSPKPAGTPKAKNTLDKFFTPSRKRKAEEEIPTESRRITLSGVNPSPITSNSHQSVSTSATISTSSQRDNQISELKHTSKETESAKTIPKPQLNSIIDPNKATNDETKSPLTEPRRIQLTTLSQKSPRRVPLITLSSKPSSSTATVESNVPLIGFDLPVQCKETKLLATQEDARLNVPKKQINDDGNMEKEVFTKDYNVEIKTKTLNYDNNEAQLVNTSQNQSGKSDITTTKEAQENINIRNVPSPRRVSFITLSSPKKKGSPTKQPVLVQDSDRPSTITTDNQKVNPIDSKSENKESVIILD